MKEELYKKAKSAKSAAELKALVLAEGMDVTDEQAAAYYEHLHKTGEMSDEELENVAGGGCHTKDGRLVVSLFHNCESYECKECGFKFGDSGFHQHSQQGMYCTCGNCKYSVSEKGLLICDRA